MTDIFISARRGAGAPAEILYGTVTFKPTLAHSRSTSIVLPAPTTFDLVDGEVVATNVQPTPTPVAGQIEWAYEVTFKDRHSKTYSFLVGVPDSASRVNFTALPRYAESKSPLFDDNAREHAERAEAAAERAEAAYGAGVLVPVPNAYAAVSTADYWVIRNTDTTALLEVGTEYVLELTPNATFTLATLQMGPTPTGSQMVDTLATDLDFTAGVPVTIKYTPSVNGLMYLRTLASASKLSSVGV